ncbi:hypothetical protein KQX54_009624 [Cotesia glomerata]|uniref:Uncharacterized protein n=1 Tax=Cotesia glomerata TaxID=32391 RepID=A0AAV7J2U9_COTGL|nr:hypothetical protein KQX54_009624 [Cotesia glomerata]
MLDVVRSANPPKVPILLISSTLAVYINHGTYIRCSDEIVLLFTQQQVFVDGFRDEETEQRIVKLKLKTELSTENRRPSNLAKETRERYRSVRAVLVILGVKIAKIKDSEIKRKKNYRNTKKE